MPSLTDILNSKRNISPDPSSPIMDEDMFSLDSVQDNAELIKYLRPVFLLSYYTDLHLWRCNHHKELQGIFKVFGIDKPYNRTPILIPPDLVGKIVQLSLSRWPMNSASFTLTHLSNRLDLMQLYLDEDDITNLQSLIERKLKNVRA